MSVIKHRCKKCGKEFNILKNNYCCKNSSSERVALGVTMDELKEMIDSSNIDVLDHLFEIREELDRKNDLIDKMKSSIKQSVRLLNLIEYTL